MLTILGVVFGVGAVVAMLSIGEGARQETLEQISVMGLHNIIVRAIPPAEQAKQSSGEKTITNSIGLSQKDADAISAECSFAQQVEANAAHKKTAFHGGAHLDVSVLGVSPAYGSIYNTRLKEGRFITTSDLRDHGNYCVLGSLAKQSLFGFDSALGKQVKLGDEWFTVIGVADEKRDVAKFAGPSDKDVNRTIFIPVTTSQLKFGLEKDVDPTSNRSSNGTPDKTKRPEAQIDQITVALQPEADAAEAATIINRVIARRHNNASDFTITVPEELLKQSQATQKIFNIVMIAIAGISLLVGGIGIMNIMLASVLERTREIGIRRALGATQRVVVSQFLSEAVILSMSGGIIGVLIGFGMTHLISAYADWRTVITPISVVIAFSVSVATGVAFGYYPARQAARKNPIDALRYE